MEFFTVRAKTFEKAREKAEQQYGHDIKIFSKKDIKNKNILSFLFKEKISCEVTFYRVKK